jgi:hypothetical protein
MTPVEQSANHSDIHLHTSAVREFFDNLSKPPEARLSIPDFKSDGRRGIDMVRCHHAAMR